MGVVAIKQCKTSDSHASNCNTSPSNSLNGKFLGKTLTKQDNVILQK